MNLSKRYKSTKQMIIPNPYYLHFLYICKDPSNDLRFRNVLTDEKKEEIKVLIEDNIMEQQWRRQDHKLEKINLERVEKLEVAKEKPGSMFI